MERVVEFRRPQGMPHTTKLSVTSKVFFSLNIIQVLAIGSCQVIMMLSGDFSAISKEGMGPGRRVYMAMFTGAVFYSCFLCLFAVKNENFLEILAFVIQNIGYVCYSFIQVYHINYKEYDHIKYRASKVISVVSILNSISLIVLNSAFIYLAFKLFGEYGWKIYKRVRFNIKLRTAYHTYELVICLMKMLILFVTLSTICMNMTILRGHYTEFQYILTLVAIPLYIVCSIAAVFSIHRENKVILTIYIILLFIAQTGYAYQGYSVGSKKCGHCQEFFVKSIDIPEEVTMHVVYVATVSFIFAFMLTIATIKAGLNFGKGLRDHFAGLSKDSTVLFMGLSREIVSTILLNTSFNRSSLSEGIPDVTVVNSSPERNHANATESDVSSISNGTNGTVSDNVNDDVRLNIPAIIKSSSLPGRTPNEQRSSVIERISRQASAKLNRLYLKRNDLDETVFEKTCGCCFSKKRRYTEEYKKSLELATIFSNAKPSKKLPNLKKESNGSVNSNRSNNNNIDNEKEEEGTEDVNLPTQVSSNDYVISTDIVKKPLRYTKSKGISLFVANDIILEEQEELSDQSSDEVVINTNNCESICVNELENIRKSRKYSEDLFVPERTYSRKFSFQPLSRTMSDFSYTSSRGSFTETSDLDSEVFGSNDLSLVTNKVARGDTLSEIASDIEVIHDQDTIDDAPTENQMSNTLVMKES